MFCVSTKLGPPEPLLEELLEVELEEVELDDVLEELVLEELVELEEVSPVPLLLEVELEEVELDDVLEELLEEELHPPPHPPHPLEEELDSIATNSEAEQEYIVAIPPETVATLFGALDTPFVHVEPGLFVRPEILKTESPACFTFTSIVEEVKPGTGISICIG